MKRLVVSLAVVAASVAALTAGGSSAAGRKCIPDKQAGVIIVNRTAVIVYCGHAKATLKSAGKTTHWTKGGACYPTAGNLLIGLGKYTSYSRPKALFNAFYLVVPAFKDGTYRLGVLHIQNKGKLETLANNVKVVVKGKLSRGTFSGKFDKGAKFTGSFTCK